MSSTWSQKPKAVATSSTTAAPQLTTEQILQKAIKRASGGGAAGAAAMFINVGTLMWMRTTVNYQYRYGTGTFTAIRKLYAEGGIPRFYRGVLPALVQGPLSRFGDTAANTGVMVLMDSYDATKDLPTMVKTTGASLAAACWRIFLMPVDTVKTTLQVEGPKALKQLFSKVGTNGPTVMYSGALAAASATFVGHYPWFATYNTLQASIPKPKDDEILKKFGRNAVIGFCSSFVSDTCSNSIRVVKVYKQSNAEAISYPECVRRIIAEDGMMGLFGRGLTTKIMSNGLQGIMFSVLWKYIDDQFFKQKA